MTSTEGSSASKMSKAQQRGRTGAGYGKHIYWVTLPKPGDKLPPQKSWVGTGILLDEGKRRRNGSVPPVHRKSESGVDRAGAD